MSLLPFSESPFQLQLSFSLLLDNLEAQALNNDAIGERARQLLQEARLYPELRTGITSAVQIENNKAFISRLLADYFPAALTLNEIKAVNIPYTDVFFNHTQRFQNILASAGPGFDLSIRDFDDHQSYVLSCCLILNEFYGTRLDFGRPLFYDIPTAEGITRHYRILYNADFLDILPTEKSRQLTQDDLHLLMDNYDDLALWKEMFPPESWILKGFSIMTLFDATVENAVSIFKEKLLGLHTEGFQDSMESIFRSIFRIPDLKIGFSIYNPEDGSFSAENFGQQIRSFILQHGGYTQAQDLLCSQSYNCLVKENSYFAVSNTADVLAAQPANLLAKRFLNQDIHSFILAPVIKNNVLLGVLEVVSSRPRELNTINANKLQVVMPFLTDTVERLVAQLQNEVQAVIQDRYTSIHRSVYWKFKEEAQKLIRRRFSGKNYVPKEIVFSDVYPLYGQVDIKGSSEARNASLQNDLKLQLTTLQALLQQVEQKTHTSLQPLLHQVKEYLAELSSPLKADTEQSVSTYIETAVHPVLKQLPLPAIQEYFKEANNSNGTFHVHRHKYETTVSQINETLADIIDDSQHQAQQLFPHYFERFKTDGVEHNLYIGPSIAPGQAFTMQKLYDLRLWQLQCLCRMEIAHQKLKPSLPYGLDVTTLILVYHSPIAIRFRMDEKRFDVDGSYNARFEIVKKRIDKAHVKNSHERITQAGKVTIVYSSEVEEEEYLGYIRNLQQQGLLQGIVEKLEVEDLQGISGLKALRVEITRQEI